MTLTAKQTTELKQQLRSERLRILSNITSLKAEFGESMADASDENGLETHLGDQGTMITRSA